jgi:hypothetical protein
MALALLMVAWVFSTPPFGGPDEAAHYLRAVSLANGQLLGPRVPFKAPTAQQGAWVDHDVRGVHVSRALSPPLWCVGGHPHRSSRGCFEATYTGDYEPLAYVLPALAIREASRSGRALWTARLASAAACVAFLLLAFVLMWTGSGWSVLGLLAAITPMTLFTGSVINPNGLEIAADLAFAAGMLRLSRRPGAIPRGVWAAVGVSGVVTVLAWQLGWIFVAADILLLAALVGRSGLSQFLSRQPKATLTTTILLISSLALFLIYGLISGLIHGAFGVQPFWASLSGGLFQLHNAAFGAVGVFGALSVGLPAGTYWVWWVIVVMIGLAALVTTSSRGRVVMVLTTAGALAFPVLFFAWVFRHSGFGLQARYVLPLLALIPLLGGELLYRARLQHLPASTDWIPYAAIAVMAGFQLFAWFINARDWAQEPNSVWFLADPRWSPPLSWLPWTIIAIGGFALLVLFAALGVNGAPPRSLREELRGDAGTAIVA